MTLARRLRATRALALAGIALTLLSYGTYKLGGISELYPFFYWRLFSEPVGADGSATYRLYTRAAPGEPWERQAMKALPTYSRKDYAYQWGALVRDVRDDSLGQTDARERLAVFARLSAPEATEFRLVEESYHPLRLLDAPADYDTTTVLRFTR